MIAIIAVTMGALLGNVVRAFTLTTGVLLAMWLWLDPEIVGKWQAKAEYTFILEAERIGMWSE